MAQIHPDDAARLGLADGATAAVRSAAGSVEVPVQVTDVVMPGVVCIPYGWGHGLPGTRQSVAAGHAGVNVNVLTDASAIDPVSGNAVLNGIPVTVASRIASIYTGASPVSREGTGARHMIERVNVIGSGRVGSAVSRASLERGLTLTDEGPELVLLCVPDRAIAEVAAEIDRGPWVAHVSGATPLAALDPHTRRFGMHPLQTFTRRRGPEQLDGAWAAVSGESDDARAAATWLAETLGLRPFPLGDERRAAYHAGAAIASNYLVTLRHAAARCSRRPARRRRRSTRSCGG